MNLRTLTIPTEYDARAFYFIPGATDLDFQYVGKFTGTVDSGNSTNILSFANEQGFIMHSNPPPNTNCHAVNPLSWSSQTSMSALDSTAYPGKQMVLINNY
jgi:hypothetical protein